VIDESAGGTSALAVILVVVALLAAVLGGCWLVLRLVLRETAKLSARIGPPDRGAPDETERD
jgi:type IV secretory pathway TrbD component